MLYRLSLLFLLLSTPSVFIDGAIFGLPVWAFASLVWTSLFALLAVLTIEREWDTLKGDKQ